jgi:hypothetical protein
MKIKEVWTRDPSIDSIDEYSREYRYNLDLL